MVRRVAVTGAVVALLCMSGPAWSGSPLRLGGAGSVSTESHSWQGIVPSTDSWVPAARSADRHRRQTAPASRAYSPHRFGTEAYNKWYARVYMQHTYGWGASEFAALEQLWERESGWSQHAHNSSSGAHGIPQALPGSKMGMFGGDWATNPETQIQWGLHYIESVYGSPSGALAHSHSYNWY